jgi:hypothetical protein
MIIDKQIIAMHGCCRAVNHELSGGGFEGESIPSEREE